MNRIINLTSHVILVQTTAGKLVAIPASGTVARVPEERLGNPAPLTKLAFLDGLGATVQVEAAVRVNEIRSGPVENLPPFEPGVTLLVSRVVAEAANRLDVVCPHEFLRSDDGYAIACTALARIFPPNRSRHA